MKILYLIVLFFLYNLNNPHSKYVPYLLHSIIAYLYIVRISYEHS